MKQFSVYTLALLLVIGTTTALASGRDHRRHSNGHNNAHRNHHSYSNHYYRHGYDRRHGFRHYRHGFYRSGFYGNSYLGAALIGSAFNYSLYHRHNGAVCYDSHASDRRGGDRYESRASYSEVVGCYRIERLPDGTEQRVDVPRSQCD